MSDRPPEAEAGSLSIAAEPQAPDLAGAVERLDHALSVMRDITRRLAEVSEVREAKVRELQDAIKNKTYHVTAEQIADKMLRRRLRDDLA